MRRLKYGRGWPSFLGIWMRYEVSAVRWWMSGRRVSASDLRRAFASDICFAMVDDAQLAIPRTYAKGWTVKRLTAWSLEVRWSPPTLRRIACG